MSDTKAGRVFREKKSELRKMFEQDEDVETAYVFGSVATGKDTNRSDIDIAVYLRESFESEKVFDKRISILNNLTKMLGEETDLVILNSAPSLLKYNVISEGEIIYSSSKTRKAEIESKILREYLDRSFYEDRHADHGLRKFAEEGLA